MPSVRLAQVHLSHSYSLERKQNREYYKYHIFEVLCASFNYFVQARIPAWGRIGAIDDQGSLRDQESCKV